MNQTSEPEQSQQPSESKREKVLRYHDEGLNVAEIAQRLKDEGEDKISEVWIKRWTKAETAPPRGVPPPQVKKATSSQPRRARPISEETAGQICAGIFSIVAVVSRDEIWFLTPGERKALGEPLADSMRTLPRPVSDAITQYSAPVVFGTTLFAIANHKANAIANKKKSAGSTIGKSQSVSSSSSTDTGSPQTTQPLTKSPPSSNGSATTHLPPEVEAAVNASANGSLIGDDEHPTGEQDLQ